MNRVRVGLTGLALVFLMALLFAALFGPVGIVQPGDSQNETLATIGVAPGGEEAAPIIPPTSVPAPAIDDPLTPPVPEPLPAIPADPNADPLPNLPADGEVTEI